MGWGLLPGSSPTLRSADTTTMTRLFVPAVLLVGCIALAQEPQTRRERPANQGEERAQSMRRQIGEGKAVQSHVKVLVRLKNGNRLVGVVKDGKLVERIDGLRFVEASAGDDGAGIRVWYTAGTRNFVFVPFADFAEYEIVQQLTNEQVLQIERELGMDRGKQAAKPEAPGEGGGKPAEAGGGQPAGAATGKPAAAADKPSDEQQKLWFDLLQAYPPTTGWGLARRDEIKRRFVVVGSQPSETELRFVDQYDEWTKACAHFGVTPAGGAEKATKPAAEKATTDVREVEKSDRRARRGETSTPAPVGPGGSQQRKDERRARRGLGNTESGGTQTGGVENGESGSGRTGG